jgi:predicted  nucleic acid-binding Zn-ribbon protein
MMPPQMYNNVRKGETVITCNNCRRILYYIEG